MNAPTSHPEDESPHRGSLEQPTSLEARRLRGFARYFKDYMGVWSFVVAALPVPVTAARLIPIYKQLRGPLSVYTSLFCFLLLGFVFFVRHQLAPLMFRRRAGKLGVGQFSLVPFVLIVGSFLCIIMYHVFLKTSVLAVSVGGTSTQILDNTDLKDVPQGWILISLYLGFFLFAEVAFILMATKEYLQDEIGISEVDLYSFILAPEPPKSSPRGVTVDADEVSASVFIDENYVGEAPCRTDLDWGEHKIKVEKRGYQTWNRVINVKPTDGELRYMARLRKE